MGDTEFRYDSSLQGHVMELFEISTRKDNTLGGRRKLKADEKLSSLSDIDIALRFEKTGTPGGCVRWKSDKAFEVIINDDCVRSLNGLILSLLVMPEQLSSEIVDVTFTSAEPWVPFRKLVSKYLAGEGAAAYWNKLPSFDPAKMLEMIGRGGRLRAEIAKHAILFATAFLALHEACHGFGGHIAYRKKMLQSSPLLGEGEFYQNLKMDQNCFELLSDIVSLTPLFSLTISHSDVFAPLAQLTRITELPRTLEADVYTGLYCTGFSAGFGIGTVFLLTDVFSMSAADDYHPAGVERMTLISGNMISKCIRRVDMEKANTELIRYIYDLGQFHGLQKCLQIWDELGLTRKRDAAFDRFFGSDKPCILCNPASEAIIERYKSATERLRSIQFKMNEWLINNKAHKAFFTSPDYLERRYLELVQLREAQLATGPRTSD
jgi:hypothetical protein